MASVAMLSYTSVLRTEYRKGFFFLNFFIIGIKLNYKSSNKNFEKTREITLQSSLERSKIKHKYAQLRRNYYIIVKLIKRVDPG